MSEHQIWKQTRRGTKSCNECRRRKIRCIRSSEDAQTCRSCEDRGTKCVEQTYSSRPLQAQRLSSRYRISQLESEVATLAKVVRTIQSKLGHQPTAVPEPAVTQAGSSPGTDDSDDDSSVSDVLAAEQPSHLRSLFQNDWLSVDTPRQNAQLQDRKAKASAHLLDVARLALQKLIPPKDELSHMTGSASKWLVLLHALLPQPSVVKSGQEILENYDNMHKPDVDAISLASWLLVVAVTAQKIPQEHDSPGTKFKKCQRLSVFSRAVSDTVEGTILSHDRLIGSIQGLGMAIHFLRLQMSQGNIQKTWIRLRHFVAIAELMGLPKATGADDDETQLQKAQLWELLCSADRLLGMIFNLPPGTRRFQQRNVQALDIDGVVQPRVYLNRLTDITTKIQYLDDMSSTQGSGPELYASALELDRELRVLASQTPKSWWDEDVEHVKPDHIVQILHHYIIMRVHLPFTMRRDPGQEYIYSRLACMDACESVAQRYQSLRRILPSGIFLSQILDLEAFTATVVLLLTSHSWPPMDRIVLETNQARIESVVAQVTKLMDEKSNDTNASNFAQHGVTIIRSLNTLLQQDGDASNVHQLRLKVPLLGNVHIRRNASPPQMPKSKNPQSFQIPSESGLWKLNGPFTPQHHGSRSLNPDTVLGYATQAQAEWQWNPLSWSIEDNHDNFFQDAFMTDDSDQFAMWQTNYNNYPSNN